jgi:uncharacterized membrane protein
MVVMFKRAKDIFISHVLRLEKDADRFVFVLIVVYTVFFSAYTLQMHYTFKTYGWDLGIIDQSLWTTLNSGKMLYSTLEVPFGNPTGNFLGVHFSPILFLLLPIYAIYQSAESLLVFQSFILGLAALPLYWIARDKLNNKLYGLAFAAAYLLNPALHGVNTFDFHLEIFTPLFVLFAFYYIEKGKWLRAFPFLVLELLTLEFAPLLVFSLGLYFLLREVWRGRRLGGSKAKLVKRLLGPSLIVVLSICAFFVALRTIETINPLKTGGPSGRWDNWGATFSEVAVNIIRNPVEAITVLITPIEKVYFLLLLLAPLLFLPLFAPLELVMPLPWILAALLTDYAPYYQPYYQYYAFIGGQIYIAGVYGFQKLYSANHGKGASRKIITTMLLSSLLIAVLMSPAGLSAYTTRSVRPYGISVAGDFDHFQKLHEIIATIPRNASIATLHDIFPHVSNRLHAYLLKWPLDYDVDYVLADLESPAFPWGIIGYYSDKATIEVMKSPEYGLLISCDGILVFKRGYHGPLQYYYPQTCIFNYNNLTTQLGRIERDYSSVSGKIILGKTDVVYPNLEPHIWFGPYRYMAPGEYSVTFRLKTSNLTAGFNIDVLADRHSWLASRNVTGEWTAVNEWQDFILNFSTADAALSPLPLLEFRGQCTSSNVEVALDYIKVEQLRPKYSNVTITTVGDGTTEPAGTYPYALLGGGLVVSARPAEGWYYDHMNRYGKEWTRSNPGVFLGLEKDEIIEVVFSR